jgi:hypothetical protein
MMENSNPKSLKGQVSVYDKLNNTSNIKFGVVKALEESSGSAENRGLGRVKVYIKGPISQGGDGEMPDTALTQDDINQLPWCFPMLPKQFYVQPKIGEVVLVFTLSQNQKHVDRLYMGPIISQLPKLDRDQYLTALDGFSFGYTQPLVNLGQIPELKGVFPSTEDVSIQGRFNTDITQKRNEILIRAGKFETATPTSANPYPMKFNASTQGYIQIKNDVVTTQKTQQQQEQRGSVINVVANKINLLTHRDGSPRFDLTNQDNLISDDSLNTILAEAHQVPFGDVLLEYLRLMKDAIFSHVHNGSGNPATDLTTSGNKQAVAIFKSKADALESSMLSKNIRIN